MTSRFPSLEFEICDMALTPAGDEGRHLCAPRRHAAATCCQPTTRRKPEYAPVSAAARAAAMDAAPSLETALDTFVQAHEVVMMHEARPQVAGGKNAQIEVRVAKLRATSTGTHEERELAVEAMRKKAADDAIAGGQKARKSKGDVVRLQLVLPAGDNRAQLPLISTPDLEISFNAKHPNSRHVNLNKAVCTDLGFVHLFDGKACKYLKVSLKYSPTDEITITSKKLGTSLKPGWVGAELRAVLVRKAAGVTAKEDEEGDA